MQQFYFNIRTNVIHEARLNRSLFYKYFFSTISLCEKLRGFSTGEREIATRY